MILEGKNGNLEIIGVAVAAGGIIKIHKYLKKEQAEKQNVLIHGRGLWIIFPKEISKN